MQSVQPISGPRNVVIKRTGASHGGDSGGGSSVVRTVEMTRSFGMNSSRGMGGPGGSSSYVHNGVHDLMDGREKERHELQGLNDRFSNYIDKVKHLEEENRRLINELAELKEQWGKETARIKAQYDNDMEQLRRNLDLAESGKAEVELKVSSLEDLIIDAQVELNEVNDIHATDKETIEKMISQLNDYESEIQSLKRRLSGLEDEKNRDDKESQRLKQELEYLKRDLEKETLAHIKAQNEVQSLRDRIEFMRKIYESEVKELAALAYKDTAESKEFWRSEMDQALRDISSEYDRKMETLQSDMEGQYSIKIQEFRTHQSRENSETIQQREENSQLKEQLAEMRNRIPELEARNNELERMLEALRREIEDRNRDFDLEKSRLKKELANKKAELESIILELQLLLDAKLSLELEIATYRKMLEGEEMRVNRSTNSNLQSRYPSNKQLDQIDLTLVKSSASNFHAAPSMRSSTSQYYTSAANKTSVTQVVKGEMSAKTSFQRTAKGNVTIQECSPDGKYIILENTGKDKEDISAYQISRNTDNSRIVVNYKLPDRTYLEPTGQNRYIKIWSRGNKPSGSKDLECNDSNWGVGSHIVTSLTNSNGDEKATHTQKTVYQM